MLKKTALFKMYGYDQKENSSAQLLRECELDKLPVMSREEYEHKYQCKLPSPSADIEQLRRDLKYFGYCYVKNALCGEQLDDATRRIQEQAEAEVYAGIAHLEGGAQYGQARKGTSNQRVFALFNKGKIFQDIATCKASVTNNGAIIWELLMGMLGRGFLLSSANANFAGKGGSAMFLHQDQGYVPLPYPPFPLVCQVIYLIDDFSQANGGTILVPRSHLVLSNGKNFKQKDIMINNREIGAISATAPKGSCLIFDGRLLHGTGANTTNRPRRGLLFYYCRGWIRQQENIYLSLSKESRKIAEPNFLQLCGFRPWRTLGQVEGEGAFKNSSFVEKPDQPVGELRLTETFEGKFFSVTQERKTFDFQKDPKSKL